MHPEPLPTREQGVIRTKGSFFSALKAGRWGLSWSQHVLRGFFFFPVPGKFRSTQKINWICFFPLSMLNEPHTIPKYSSLCQVGTFQASTIANICTHTKQDRSMARAGCEAGSSQIHFQCRVGTFTGFEFPYP